MHDKTKRAVEAHVVFAQWLEETGFPFYRFYGVHYNVATNRFEFTTFDDFQDTEENKQHLRLLKKLLGPFETQGEPPNVQLRGFTELDGGVTVSLTMLGSYSCVIDKYTEEDRNPADTQRQRELLKERLAQLDLPKRVAHYTCTAKAVS